MTKASQSRAKRAAAKKIAEVSQTQTVTRKPGDIVTFSPAKSDMVYRFRVLDLTQRAEYRRDMRAKGCIPPTSAEVNAVCREGIDAKFTGEEADRMHATLDALEQFNEDFARLSGVPEKAKLEELQRAGKRAKDGYVATIYRVRKVYPPLAEMDGDIQFARDANNLVVMRWVLVGWENYTRLSDAADPKSPREPVPFAVDADGMPTQETLAAIPQEHFFQVVNKSYDMVQLGQATIKN